LVTSVLLKLAARVKSNLPAVSALYGTAEHDVDAVGGGVDAVDEEAAAAHAGEALRGQVGAPGGSVRFSDSTMRSRS
jgi:hypothetical protein